MTIYLSMYGSLEASYAPPATGNTDPTTPLAVWRAMQEAAAGQLSQDSERPAPPPIYPYLPTERLKRAAANPTPGAACIIGYYDDDFNVWRTELEDWANREDAHVSPDEVAWKVETARHQMERAKHDALKEAGEDTAARIQGYFLRYYYGDRGPRRRGLQEVVQVGAAVLKWAWNGMIIYDK